MQTKNWMHKALKIVVLTQPYNQLICSTLEKNIYISIVDCHHFNHICTLDQLIINFQTHMHTRSTDHQGRPQTTMLASMTTISTHCASHARVANNHIKEKLLKLRTKISLAKMCFVLFDVDVEFQ